MATPRQIKKRFVKKSHTTCRDKFKVGDIAFLVDYSVVDPGKADYGNYGFPKKAKNYGFKHGTKVEVTRVLESRNTSTQGNTYEVIRCDNDSKSPKKYIFRSVMLWREPDYKKLNAQYSQVYNAQTNEFFSVPKISETPKQLQFDFDSITSVKQENALEQRNAILEYAISQVDNLSKLLRAILNSN